jgi:hypothetical protein
MEYITPVNKRITEDHNMHNNWLDVKTLGFLNNCVWEAQTGSRN